MLREGVKFTPNIIMENFNFNHFDVRNINPVNKGYLWLHSAIVANTLTDKGIMCVQLFSFCIKLIFMKLFTNTSGKKNSQPVTVIFYRVLNKYPIS
jgi:hypothetical protein